MRKSLLSLFLMILLLTCAVMVSAEEDEGIAAGPGLSWFFEDGTLTVSGSGEMDDMKDGAPWEDFKDSITKVVLEDGIQSVGAYAFEDYDKITEVDFGDSLKYLGQRCFADCDGLTSIHLPKTFKRFDEEALRNCPNLKEIHFDGGFPRFELNCLWQTECKLYYPASAPWSVIYIEQLETAFHGRIEFLDSNGVDHYTYTEPTEATTEATTAPTTAPTTVPTTEPVTIATTAPTTRPTEPETVPTTDAPTTEDTRETFLFGTEATTQPTEPARKSGNGGVIGLAIVAFVCSILGLGGIIYSSSNKRGKYDR